jgi:hypothetical protein
MQATDQGKSHRPGERDLRFSGTGSAWDASTFYEVQFPASTDCSYDGPVSPSTPSTDASENDSISEEEATDPVEKENDSEREEDKLKDKNKGFDSSKCEKCKFTAARFGRSWKEACATQCSEKIDTSAENMWQKLHSDFKGKQECPKFKFTWKCVHAYMPHITIAGVSGNLNAAVGGIEAVTDYQTFQVGFFVYGGLSVGTNWLTLGSVGVYAGLGYKGALKNLHIGKAYSEYFLAVDGSVNAFLAGANVIGAVSASADVIPVVGAKTAALRAIVTRPRFDQVKTLCVGVTLEAANPVPGPSLNFAQTYYKEMYTLTCEHPHCFAAVTTLMPGEPIMKVVSMKMFMDKYCGSSSKHKGAVICKTYRALKSLVSDTIKFWAEKGLAGGLQEAYKAGKELAAAQIAKLRQQFHSAVERSKKQINAFMKEHVGKKADSVRSLLGDVSPEEKPIQIIPMPSGSGTYIKFKSCSHISKMSTEYEPYWNCKRYNGNERSSQVGLKNGPNKGKFYWDYSQDETKTGFGMMFRDGIGDCVTCYLVNRHRMGHSLRFGDDEEFEDIKLSVCSGSSNEFRPFPIKKGGTTLGYCNMLYHHQK